MLKNRYKSKQGLLTTTSLTLTDLAPDLNRFGPWP